MTSPHQVTKDFEKAVAEYTGAPYAVAVNSCTMALLLAVAWHMQWRDPHGKPFHSCGRVIGANDVEIPKRTYVGVPYAIREAGGQPTFREERWVGAYQLKPLPVWDSARWFTSGLWSEIDGRAILDSGIGPGEKVPPPPMICLSFHAAKTLGDSQGGAILHNDWKADDWLRRARFDGRTEGVPPALDNFQLPRAWHCYLSPDVSARLLWRLSVLPKHNEPLPNDSYPDLSTLEAFK